MKSNERTVAGRGWLDRLVRCFGGLTALEMFLLAVAFVLLAATGVIHQLELNALRERVQTLEASDTSKRATK